MIQQYIDLDPNDLFYYLSFITEHARSGHGVHSLVSFPQVSVPVRCQIPFSKLIYCTCIFPSLDLHSLPFFCVFAGEPLSRALIERRTERLYKARASVLSRGSLGYRGTSGPAAPCVHTQSRSVKITHIPEGVNLNANVIKSLESHPIYSSICLYKQL